MACLQPCRCCGARSVGASQAACKPVAEQMQATSASLRGLQSEPSIGEPSAAVLAALQYRRDRPE